MTLPAYCWERVGVEGDMTCPQLETHKHCRHCSEYQQSAQTVFQRNTGEAYRLELERKLAQDAPTLQGEKIPAMTFRLGDIWLAFHASIYEHIVPGVRPHSIPWRNNEVLRGIINSDGELLLVYDLQAALGLEAFDLSPETLQFRILLCHYQNKRWALPVDEVGEIVYHSSSLLPLPASTPGVLNGVASGLLKLEVRDVVLLDEKKVFALLETLSKA